MSNHGSSPERGYGWENGSKVAVTWPECFRDKEDVTEAEIKRLEIIAAAYRVLLCEEHRTEQQIADEIGCTQQAINAAITRIAKALPGFGRFLKSEDARENMAESARQKHAAKKKEKQLAA